MWSDHRDYMQFQGTIKGLKGGGWPNSWNSPLFPKIVRIILPLISLWNYQPIKTNHTTFQGRCTYPLRWPTFCLWSMFLPWQLSLCNMTTYRGAALIPWDRPHSVYGMCISLNKSASQLSSWRRALLPAHLSPSQASCINKSASYLSLCLLLNSFCAET